MRKLASVKRIKDIQPIEGADAIEVATVDGWKVVTKKGEHQIGDLVVYLEIDSWVPQELAPFLIKGDAKEYNGVKGERLRTVKLRGQVSQGLILPVSVLPAGVVHEGLDVTEILGIQKYDPPMPANLAGEARGLFPSEVPKTDETRCQNLEDEIADWYNRDIIFEWTEKMDGSSATFFLSVADDFHVCSRNLSLKERGDNAFWQIAKRYSIQEKMEALGMQGMAIQGELIGEGIQGNKYRMKGVDFFCFTIYDTRTCRYLSAEARKTVCAALGLKHVPVIQTSKLPSRYVSKLLTMAEDKSIINPKQEREGLVFKAVDDGSIHFKAISNKFLLKGGE